MWGLCSMCSNVMCSLIGRSTHPEACHRSTCRRTCHSPLLSARALPPCCCPHGHAGSCPAGRCGAAATTAALPATAPLLPALPPRRRAAAAAAPAARSGRVPAIRNSRFGGWGAQGRVAVWPQQVDEHSWRACELVGADTRASCPRAQRVPPPGSVEE